MRRPIRYLLPLLWAILIWRLTTTPNLVVAPESWLNTLIMSGSHFFFFGVLAVLLSVCFRYQPSIIDHWPLLLTSLYGLLIELVQRGIPGRSADPVDWLLDTTGALIFLFVFRKYAKSVWNL